MASCPAFFSATLQSAHDVPGVPDAAVSRARAPDEAATAGATLLVPAAAHVACPAPFSAGCSAEQAHGSGSLHCCAHGAAQSGPSSGACIDAPSHRAAADITPPPAAPAVDLVVNLAELSHAPVSCSVERAPSVGSETLSPSSKASFECASDAVLLPLPCAARDARLSGLCGAVCAPRTTIFAPTSSHVGEPLCPSHAALGTGSSCASSCASEDVPCAMFSLGCDARCPPRQSLPTACLGLCGAAAVAPTLRTDVDLPCVSHAVLGPQPSRAFACAFEDVPRVVSRVEGGARRASRQAHPVACVSPPVAACRHPPVGCRPMPACSSRAALVMPPASPLSCAVGGASCSASSCSGGPSCAPRRAPPSASVWPCGAPFCPPFRAAPFSRVPSSLALRPASAPCRFLRPPAPALCPSPLAPPPAPPPPLCAHVPPPSRALTVSAEVAPLSRAPAPSRRARGRASRGRRSRRAPLAVESQVPAISSRPQALVRISSPAPSAPRPPPTPQKGLLLKGHITTNVSATTVLYGRLS